MEGDEGRDSRKRADGMRGRRGAKKRRAEGMGEERRAKGNRRRVWETGGGRWWTGEKDHQETGRGYGSRTRRRKGGLKVKVIR